MLTTQLKITLPLRLFDYIQAKADRFGLTISSYLKYLIIDDVQDMDLPEFPMSQKTERTALKALKDYRLGKTKKLNSIDRLLRSL